MNQSEKIKENIKIQVDKITKGKDFILSTSIVGSFYYKDIDSISDIDIIIIVNELNKQKFDLIISEFNGINCDSIGLDDYKIFVNSSFGPLKYDSDKLIVFHVMIYDIDGHIRHVEKSPFTCISWEQFPKLNGKSLSDIYPVVTLELSDLINSRRGLISYLNDLNSGVITYRDYEFNQLTFREIERSFSLDEKHKLEYSYHIIFHLLNNFYKIITQNLNTLSVSELMHFYSKLRLDKKINLDLLQQLSNWKNNKTDIQSDDIIDKIKFFLKSFFKFLENQIESSPNVYFIRHQKTNLNNGTFLGIRRNPSIIDFEPNINDKFIIGYHSKLKRSKQTIQKFNCVSLFETDLLNEIDYGLCEGISFDNLQNKFPEITNAWAKNQDPKFPKGENQIDVSIRVNFFLNKVLKKNKKSLVVTHLVTLRLVLFNLINLPLSDLYKIKINHLDGFEFICYKEFLIPNFKSEFRKALRTQLSNYA